MTINRSTLLDLPLPVTGTEDGTWGDVTNNGLTEYLDIAIAGMTSLTSSDFTANELTLALTEGTNTATNIVGSSAQYSAIRVSSLAANSTITAPSSNRAYKVINADSTYSLTVKASGQTGVTFLPGTAGWVAFNGTDYFILGVVGPASATDNAVARFDGTTGKIVQNSAVTIADTSGNITGGTYNKVTITAPATGSTLTIADGKTLTANNSLTLGGTDATTMTFPSTSATIARTDAAQTFTGDQTVAGNVTLNAQGDLRFADSDSSNWVAFQAPATIPTNITWTLPNADGTNGQALVTDGSGTLSWATATGGGGGGTSVTVTQITATGGQTTFNVTYTVGQLSVYLNGALLASADYTATNGTTVVLAAGAAANDIFTAVAYSTVAGLTLQSASPFGTLVGSGAGAVNTGVNNVFVGFEAGNDNTTGTDNTAVGWKSLDVNTTGRYNTALGADSLHSSTTASNNTALGYQAAYTNTTGKGNIAIGVYSMYSNTTGNFNTAVGSGEVGVVFGALHNNTTGSNNVALGTSALYANTTASNNTAIGYQALYANTTGTENVAVGYAALDANTTGVGNIAIGTDALGANTTGIRNIAIGLYAMRAGGNGGYNVAIGAYAMYDGPTGSENVGIGEQSLYALTSGSYNTAIGRLSLTANTTGAYNTAVGWKAADAVTTAQDITAVGRDAGGACTTGTDNTFLGANAGANITTGASNVFVGRNCSASAAGGTNQIVIGPNVTGQADTNVTIGNSTGKIYNAYTVNATWTQTSDERLKKNIQDDTLGLSFVNRLRPVKYQWKPSYEIDPSLPYYNEKNNRDTETVMHGLVAQEVKAALDAEGVTTFAGWDVGPDTIQAISREMFISPLIKAIQELSAKCDSLQAEINTLKGQ